MLENRIENYSLSSYGLNETDDSCDMYFIKINLNTAPWPMMETADNDWLTDWLELLIHFDTWQHSAQNAESWSPPN